MGVLLDLALGVVTSVAGFVEVGSISTAAQAGSEFRFALLWAVALAGVILALLAEMSGRVAAVSRCTIAGAVRERFGIHFQILPLTAELLLDVLLLSAELGGAAIAIKLMTGVGFQWWILPLALVAWTVLRTGSFKVIEDGIGLLGLVTLSFVASAWRAHPDVARLTSGFIPTVPDHDVVRYSFLAISIVGATVSPYLLNFYASGTVEEKLTEDKLWVNRTTAFLGIGFGAVVSMGVLVTAAVVLAPPQIQVNSYEQAALMFVPAFGRWAVGLFAAALGIGCFGAAVEIALNGGYVVAQVLGWRWGADKSRSDARGFSAAMTAMVVIASAIALLGFDPLQVTMICVALTVVVMPAVVLPFLVLMNDPAYVGRHTSGIIGNGFLAIITVAGAAMALVVIPLEMFGG